MTGPDGKVPGPSQRALNIMLTVIGVLLVGVAVPLLIALWEWAL